MSEKLNFSPKRKTAALVAGLAIGVGFAEAGPALADRPTHQSVEAPTSLEKKRIVLVRVGEFDLDNGHNGIVSVLREKGVETKNNPFSFKNIKRAVGVAAGIGNKRPVLPLTLGTYTSAETVILPLRISLAPEEFHGFAVVKDAHSVEALTGVYTPAATTIELNSKKPGRVTYIAEASGFEPTIAANISFDYYDLQTETCNNILNARLTKDGHNILQEQFGVVPGSLDTALVKIGHEAVCNSYGLAAATKQAGFSYKRYKNLTQEQELQSSVALGLRVPYIVFPKQLWAIMK